MADDDYEILPHAELDYLRHEVERLKKNPFGDTHTGQTMLDAMNNLTNSINKLTNILETANDEIIKDYEDNKLSSRMDRINEHNEKLAEGLVAVTKVLKEIQADEKKASAIRGGYTDFSTFGKNITTSPQKSQTNTSQEKSANNNPFEQTKKEEVTLDQDLPRHSFSAMDPKQPSQQQAPAQNTQQEAQQKEDYPVMGEQKEEPSQEKKQGPLPSFKDLPPPPNNMPPLDDVPKP